MQNLSQAVGPCTFPLIPWPGLQSWGQGLQLLPLYQYAVAVRC